MRPLLEADESDEQPDGATSDDDDPFSRGDFAEPNVVAGHGEGLNHGAVFEADGRGQVVDGVVGDRPRGLHTTRQIDADELQVFPHVGMALVKRRWLTELHGSHRHSVADDDSRDARPHFSDDARRLVSDDQGTLYAAIHGPVIDVYVGTTDPAVSHVEPDLAGTRSDRIARADLNASITEVLG